MDYRLLSAFDQVPVVHRINDGFITKLRSIHSSSIIERNRVYFNDSSVSAMGLPWHKRKLRYGIHDDMGQLILININLSLSLSHSLSHSLSLFSLRYSVSLAVFVFHRIPSLLLLIQKF